MIPMWIWRHLPDSMKYPAHCMGIVRAPICYLDDYLHRWLPVTFYRERLDTAEEHWLRRLHDWMADRYWARKLGE